MNKGHVGRSGYPVATRKTLFSMFVVGLLGIRLALTGVGAEGRVPSSASSNLEARGGSSSRQRLHQTMALDSATASSSSKTQRRFNAVVGRDSATVTTRAFSHRHSLETCESDSSKNEVEGVDGNEADVRVDETDGDYSETTQDNEEYDTTTEEDTSSDYYGSDDPSPLTSSQREGIEDGVELEDSPDSVRVCVVTWNLAEVSPPARDVEFIRRVSRESDLVAVGVQEIENLKPRRHEGGRTREWRRLLIRLCLPMI